MGCLLWEIWRKFTALKRHRTVLGVFQLWQTSKRLIENAGDDIFYSALSHFIHQCWLIFIRWQPYQYIDFHYKEKTTPRPYYIFMMWNIYQERWPLYWNGALHLWKYWPSAVHHDVIKWKHFPRYWQSPVNSPHKGLWRGDLIFSLICA